MYPQKLFVREKGDNLTLSKNKHVSYNVATNLMGNEAKTFYEDVLKIKSDKKPVATKSPKLGNCKKPKIEIIKDNIFKLAETNNVTALSQLISSCVDLNVKDSFGWTPLMCASCSGAFDAVQILVNAGADKTACSPGYTALHLAKKHKHRDIVNFLNGVSSLNSISSSGLSETKTKISFCELCKQNYSTSKAKHESSTAHLIEMNSRKVKTFYGIPESNRGFQMLLRNGWNRDRGLGPEGVGRKFPVKPSMKKDRTGIGCVQQKKKQNCTESSSDVPVNCNHQKMEDPIKSLEYLKQIESAGQEIVQNKQEILALDIRRNEAREGLRALEKSDADKTFLALGPMLIKMPTTQAKELLQNDVNQVDMEINKIRSDLKVKVNTLRDLEHQPPVPGLMLNPLSSAEVKAMGR